jgi:Protein of unknown function (DUF2867)
LNGRDREPYVGRRCARWRSSAIPRVVYRFENELLNEMHRRTVHAALLMALAETEAGSRFYLAVYVCKVGWITPLYMALIDPFRRWIVYPALLKNIRAIWAESCALKGPEQKGRS